MRELCNSLLPLPLHPQYLEHLVDGRRVGVPQRLLQPRNEPLSPHTRQVPSGQLLAIPCNLSLGAGGRGTGQSGTDTPTQTEGIYRAIQRSLRMLGPFPLQSAESLPPEGRWARPLPSHQRGAGPVPFPAPLDAP